METLLLTVRHLHQGWDIGLDDDRHWLALASPTPTCVLVIAAPTLQALARELATFPVRRRAWLS